MYGRVLGLSLVALMWGVSSCSRSMDSASAGGVGAATDRRDQRPRVPAQAPDTVPAGLFDESNIRGTSACVTGPLVRGIVVLTFREGATQAERQEAIDGIQGEVIGGRHRGSGEGYYYVRVEDDEDGQVLCQAFEHLNALPQVRRARAELLLGLF